MSTPPAASRPAVSDRAEARYAFMRALTEEDERAWTLLHLCEAHARLLQPIADLLDHDDAGSGRRRRLDPDRCPPAALPALAENYAGVEPGRLTEGELRDAIRDRPRRRRCTRPAFDSAVKRTLTGTRLIRVVENEPEASRATLVTRPGETPDPAATLAAAESQTPWWVQLTATTSDSPVWDEATVAWDDLPAGVTWDNVTRADVRTEET